MMGLLMSGHVATEPRSASNDRVGVTPHVTYPCYSVCFCKIIHESLVFHGSDVRRPYPHERATDHHGCAKGKDGDDEAHADGQGSCQEIIVHSRPDGDVNSEPRK